MNNSLLNVNNVNTPASILQLGCYGVTSLFIGRKVTQFLISGTYNIGSKIADYVDRKDLSESLQIKSVEYFDSARKNLVRDLTFAAGFGALGFGINSDPQKTDIEKTETPDTIIPDTNNRKIFIDFNEMCYVGEIKNNMTYGNETVTLPNRMRYVEYPDGGKYIGGFENGMRDGPGTMICSDGVNYVGGFKKNMRHGPGTLTFPNKMKYVGGFENNKLSGQGTLTFPNGIKYIGGFENDMFNGQGTMICPRGEMYVGRYEKGRRNGPGTLTSPNGAVCEGYYEGRVGYLDCNFDMIIPGINFNIHKMLRYLGLEYNFID